MYLSQKEAIQIRRFLLKHFSQNEIANLSYDLGVNYEDLPGGTREAKGRELVAYCQRRGWTKDLLTELRDRRPEPFAHSNLPDPERVGVAVSEKAPTNAGDHFYTDSSLAKQSRKKKAGFNIPIWFVIPTAGLVLLLCFGAGFLFFEGISQVRERSTQTAEAIAELLTISAAGTVSNPITNETSTPSPETETPALTSTNTPTPTHEPSPTSSLTPTNGPVVNLPPNPTNTPTPNPPTETFTPVPPTETNTPSPQTVNLSSTADSWFRRGGPWEPVTYGHDTQLLLVTQANSVIVVYFDLSSIQFDASIMEATLYLYLEETAENGLQVTTRRADSSWSEEDISVPAPECASESGPTTFVNVTPGEYSWNVTGVVQDHYQNPGTNFGICLDSDATETTVLQFASREGSVGRRPRLAVTFVQ